MGPCCTPCWQRIGAMALAHLLFGTEACPNPAARVADNDVGRKGGKGMKPASLFLCLGVLLYSAATAAARPAYVLSPVHLRAAPGIGSEILATIPGGSPVDASACSGGWCAVNWQGEKGFSVQSALDFSGRVPPGPPPGYVEGPPVYNEDAPPPPAYYYGPYYRPWRWHRRYW